MFFSFLAIVCKDPIYGEGRENDIKEKNCEEGQTGTKTAVCLAGTWKPTKDTCIVTVIKDLLTEAVVGSFLLTNGSQNLVMP